MAFGCAIGRTLAIIQGFLSFSVNFLCLPVDIGILAPLIKGAVGLGRGGLPSQTQLIYQSMC